MHTLVIISQLQVWCNAATINLYIQPVIVFLSLFDMFQNHNHGETVWQLAPNEGLVRENTVQVDIDFPDRTCTEWVLIIQWNFLSDRELQSINQPCEQCFLLRFWSKLADPTSCYCCYCNFIHPGILTKVVFSIDPGIKSTGLLLEQCSLREWHNHVYVSVTQLRNSSRLLSLIGLIIMQEYRMSPLGCWRNSKFHLTYEPCLCKGCYWGTQTFISMACHRRLSFWTITVERFKHWCRMPPICYCWAHSR